MNADLVVCHERSFAVPPGAAPQSSGLADGNSNHYGEKDMSL